MPDRGLPMTLPEIEALRAPLETAHVPAVEAVLLAQGEAIAQAIERGENVDVAIARYSGDLAAVLLMIYEGGVSAGADATFPEFDLDPDG